MSSLTSTFILEKLNTKYNDAILFSIQHYDIFTLHIKKEKIHEVIRFLYDDPELQFQFLTTLCGINNPDKKDQELGVIYHLHNLKNNSRLRLKTFFSVEDPHIPTVTDIFLAANWMERETYDFFGIIFDGHPNLKRILNMDTMDYFPMRKEYPLEDQTRLDKNDSQFGR